ncbi:MAG: DUF4870 domain-containing protein [Candidatus Micrarchaeota archaeon]|nr:DUF4870 domain-containing protein [Candidatus Micrarchaeota archaeon]
MADEKKNVQKGDDNSRLLGAISYFLGILAVLLFLVKKDDKFVKFHAVQAALLNILWIIVFVVWFVLSMVLAVVTIPIGGIGGMAWICVLPLGLVMLIVMLYGAWKAFSGEMWKMPLIGGLSDKYSS